MQKHGFIFMGGLFAVLISGAALSAQAKRSVNEGVFTKAQADRGSVVYLEQCAACHGDNLEGSGPMPPLAGGDFLVNWTGKSVGELFEKTHTTMPATAPGTMTPQQVADVTAFMLARSNYPAGTTELAASVEALNTITLDPVGAAPAAAPATAATPAPASKPTGAQ